MQTTDRPYSWKIVLTVLCVLPLLASPIYRLKVSAQEQPAGDGKKTVLVIDTSSKSREIIYDPESKNNADEIFKALSPLKDKIKVDIQLITPDWKGEDEVLKKRPDLIIIHESAYYDIKGPLTEVKRFELFLNSVAKTRTKLLKFSRVVNTTGNRPESIYTFMHNKGAALTFRDPDVRKILIQQVSKILNLRP